VSEHLFLARYDGTAEAGLKRRYSLLSDGSKKSMIALFLEIARDERTLKVTDRIIVTKTRLVETSIHTFCVVVYSSTAVARQTNIETTKA